MTAMVMAMMMMMMMMMMTMKKMKMGTAAWRPQAQRTTVSGGGPVRAATCRIGQAAAPAPKPHS
jgi:hypothetical protein